LHVTTSSKIVHSRP